jgi:hypothetical protein
VNHTTITTTASILLALLLTVVPGVPEGAMAQGSSPDAKRTPSPFVCNRRALTSEQRKRHFDELGPQLLSLKKSVRELPNGYEFEFPSDAKTIQLATEWAIGERACCPFFDINLRLEREGGPLWMGVTGREGVKQFIQADGAAWLKR